MSDEGVLRRGIPYQLTLLATVISAGAYGIVVSLYFRSFRALMNAGKRYSKRKRHILFTYITAMTLLSTLALVQEISASIFDLSLLGVMSLSSLIQLSSWVLPFTIWGADGFKMWRCAALYYEGVPQRSRLTLLCLLCFFGLISSVGGIILLAAPFLHRHAVPLGFLATPVFLISVSAISNVTLSLLITLRILHHQVHIRVALGASHGSLYTRIIVMCVESCSLIVVPALVYIVLHFTEAKGSQIPLFLLPHLCVISPLLIVCRVVEGRDASTTFNRTEVADDALNQIESDIHFTISPAVGVRELSKEGHPGNHPIVSGMGQHFR